MNMFIWKVYVYVNIKDTMYQNRGERDIIKMAELAAPNSHTFTETLKNNQQLSDQLCQNSGKYSKVYSNQANA